MKSILIALVVASTFNVHAETQQCKSYSTLLEQQANGGQGFKPFVQVGPDGNDILINNIEAAIEITKVNCEQSKLPAPKLGMTMKQVVEKTSWGSPDRIHSTNSVYGKREQWVYEGVGYLYFEHGKLTSIQR